MATTPGQMSLYDIQCRTLHLLFEPGPDTGTTPIPTSGDFNETVLVRDANIKLGMFIGLTGISPSLSEAVTTLNIVAGLDYALPSNCASLMRVEYTPAGQYPYTLVGKSFDDFDSTTGGIVPPATGQPYYYRRPFAGLIRLQPQPGPGNAGLANGTIDFAGTPVTGAQVTVHLSNGTTNVTVGPYTVLSTDTMTSIASAVCSLINASAAVTGGSAFLGLATVPDAGTTIDLVAASSGTAANAFTYYVSATSTTLGVSPTTSTTLTGGGVADTISIYYESLGSILVNSTDVPGIPSQFHMAIVYGMLQDYWLRKGDPSQSDRYGKLFDQLVRQAKAYQYDIDRSSQFTTAGEDVDVNYADGIVG